MNCGRTEDVLALDLPYRDQLRLRRRVYAGADDGPRVAVVSGIHGDELEGLYLCHRLAQAVEGVVGSQPAALRGTVELYPALNPLGLDTMQRALPIHDVDLNRTFPGAPDGMLPQRLADAAMAALAGASLVIDVHASNVFLREIPQVRINQTFAPRLVPLARGMNVDVIWLHGALTVLEATIAHSLNARGVPCLVVEMGVGLRVTPELTEQVLTGILGLWRDLGVLDASVSLPPRTHEPLLADDRNVHYLNAPISGLFLPASEHWTAVRRDQLLGRIVSPLDAEVLAEVRAPVDGMLFTLREYPLVWEGSLMARIVAT